MDQVLQRIMYVEDEPDIQAVACLALEHIGGFTVEVCSSGREALEKLPQFQPDLILLDVMMPGMDGPTTLLALRATPIAEAMLAIVLMDHLLRHRGQNQDVNSQTPVIPAKPE